MKKLFYLLMTFMLLSHFFVEATIYKVGSLQSYTSPNQLYSANVLVAGDTIEIDAETYTGAACLAAWYPDSLLIRGVGGRPHLVANGQYIQGKGIWVLGGDNITVENIEFSGATVPDQNGAGIRLDGTGMTVRNCYFHDNEDGILTSNPYAGDILIEYSEFGYNGYGDGYSHNMYIGHVNSFTFRHNYTHHANIGHTIKSRADTNYILYNRIMDEETGNSSRLIDLPNGGHAVIMGNIMMQGPLAENNNLIGFGSEGLSNNAPHEIFIVNNTMLNYRQASCIFIDMNTSINSSVIINNIFAGTGTLVNGGSINEIAANYNDTQISNLLFADENNYDYHLLQGSPAIDSGIVVAPVNDFSLIPEYEYVHSCSAIARQIYYSIDIGAYEFEDLSSSSESYFPEILFYPNPTKDFIFLPEELIDADYSVFDLKGKKLKGAKLNSNEIDFSDLNSGIYFIEVRYLQKRFTGRIIKE